MNTGYKFKFKLKYEVYTVTYTGGAKPVSIARGVKLPGYIINTNKTAKSTIYKLAHLLELRPDQIKKVYYEGRTIEEYTLDFEKPEDRALLKEIQKRRGAA